MVTVHRSVDWFDAHLIHGLLRAHGLQAHVLDEGMVRQYWIAALAIGGARVVVPPHEAEAAAELLDAHRQGEFLPEGETLSPPSWPSRARLIAWTSWLLLGFPLWAGRLTIPCQATEPKPGPRSLQP